MGIICYALYFSQVWSPSKHVVLFNIETVAAVGYPFVVLPVIILTSFLQGEGLTGHLIVSKWEHLKEEVLYFSKYWVCHQSLVMESQKVCTSKNHL